MSGNLLDGHLSSTVMRITGISDKQINHWTKTGLITPSIDVGVRGRNGGAQVRRWSFEDVVTIKTILDLRNAGIPLQALRKIAERLSQHGQSFADTYLVVSGDDVLTRRGDQLESTLKNPGQLAMYALIYDVGRAATAMRAALEEIAA